MSNIYGKGAKGRATKLHAQIIRSKGSCEKCGAGEQAFLQCAHIISRKYSWTRTDLDNAFCLCASCHRFFTDNPVEFGIFTIDKIGDDKFDELIGKRNCIDKFDWDEEADRLKAIAKEEGLI